MAVSRAPSSRAALGSSAAREIRSSSDSNRMGVRVLRVREVVSSTTADLAIIQSHECSALAHFNCRRAGTNFDNAREYTSSVNVSLFAEFGPRSSA